ncbi:MAG: ATP-binding cassette domain-containing protein, partial [Streptosporangiales bacterium]
MTGSLLAPRHARRRAGKAAGDTRRDVGLAASDGAETGAEPGGTPLLTVSGLSLSYGRLRALHDIDLSVRSGELVALAGENGAGKTTLVRCIAGDVVP